MDTNRVKRTTKEKRNYPSGITSRTGKTKSSIQIAFTYQGKHRRETINLPPTKANISYAERLRAEILNAIERKTFNYEEYFPNSKIGKTIAANKHKLKLKQALEAYLIEAKNHLEHSSYEGYRKIIQNILMPKLGNLTFKELTPIIIRGFVSDLNASAKRIRNILVPLRAVVGRALNDDFIDKDPFLRIDFKPLLKNKPKSEYKPDPFSQDEIKTILSSCDGQERNLYQFAFFSGLRTNELIGLNWDDVDFENKIIRVRRGVVLKREKGPKTASGNRDVLMLPPAEEALRQQMQFTYLLGQRVFHNPKTNLPWESYNQLGQRSWGYIVRASKVRYRNQYQTRHTYASMLLSKGENIGWVAKQMGHVDIEMVMRVYAQWIPDTTKSIYKPVGDWDSIHNNIKVTA